MDPKRKRVMRVNNLDVMALTVDRLFSIAVLDEIVITA